MLLRYGELVPWFGDPEPFACVTQALAPDVAFELHVPLAVDRGEMNERDRRAAADLIRAARRMIRDDIRRHTQ